MGFRVKDLKTIRRVLSYCYLGDWWVLYQIGRNSNTHFFRYLLRHIELCICHGNNGVTGGTGSILVVGGTGKKKRRGHSKGGNGGGFRSTRPASSDATVAPPSISECDEPDDDD